MKSKIQQLNDNITLYNGDCLEIMQSLGKVDAVITDPPYGEEIGNMGFTKTRVGGVTLRNDYSGQGAWDSKRISEQHIKEMINISRTQVIFGGNFYADMLPPSRGWFVWDKKDGGKYSNDFADCELAWTNQDVPSRLVRHIWHGMIQQNMKNKEKRYHPTQKPVAVMVSAIERYTNPGDTILDPFMGSGSTIVACIQTGRRAIGIEIEEKYFDISVKRAKEALLQTRMEI